MLNHYVGASVSPSLSAHLDQILFPASRSENILSPIFCYGVVMVVIGSYIRVRCFQELGQLFTFDLTMYPEHKLVTSGPYSYVRHPAYTGSFFVIAGITFSQLTPGSLVECFLGPVWSTFVWATWWVWSVAVIKSRVLAEDQELQKHLSSEWNAYAARVKYRFVTGLI